MEEIPLPPDPDTEDVPMHDVAESPDDSSMISRRSSSPSVESSNLDSMRSMTDSMSKLSMIQPSAQEAAPAHKSPQAPPTTMKRAAPASHQSPPGDLPTRGTRGAPQNSRGSRVSSRGRGPHTMTMVSSSPTAASSTPSSSSSRGASSRGASSRGTSSRGASSRGTSSRGASLRGRGAKQARQYPPGPLPQVETSQLPQVTPPEFSHYLMELHPWAKYVNPRPIRLLRQDCPPVSSVLDVEVYRHLPDSGYLSTRFNRSLFPKAVLRPDKMPASIPFIELQHLEDTINFRAKSKIVIDQVLSGSYSDVDTAHIKPSPYQKYITKPPPYGSTYPVLYQVVSTGYGPGVILEAKDFFVVGPDRRDLHCIVLDQYAVDIVTGGRGFNKNNMSVKDFVWVYNVKPTRQALQSPASVLKQASLPRTMALDTSSVFFFRASHFALLTVNDLPDQVYGIILSRTIRADRVIHARAVFEGCPEAVTLTPSTCTFPLRRLATYEVVSARTRVNVSAAMRFCEPPVSFESRAQLAELVRSFLPMHPDEGISPLAVFKLPQVDEAWLADRLARFHNFQRDPVGSKQRLSKICNVACSALAAVHAVGDDKQTRKVLASICTPVWYPLRIQFTLQDMASEAGWAPGRHVITWIPGTERLIWAKVVTVTSDPTRKTVTVVIQAFTWSHEAWNRAFEQHGRMLEEKHICDICVRLGKSTTAANPVYDLVSRSNIFGNLRPRVMGDQVVNLFYANQAIGTSDEPYLRDLPPPSGHPRSFIVSGRSLTLTTDQEDAVRIGSGQLPLVAIQAAYGTGKTLVGSLIAALTSVSSKDITIVTTSTNAAVAQFTETLLSLNDFAHLNIVRNISDTAAAVNQTPTSVDLGKILRTLGDDYEEQLSHEDLHTCHEFQEYREIIENYLDHPELIPNMSDEDKEEYEIAERYVSQTLKRMVNIMFTVRRPSIICMTTASLLNSTASGGIFTPYLTEFTTVIGDEASQIPEPTLLAIAGRLTRARHVYIGDVHQLAPHVKCPPNSSPVLHGARSVMSLLLQSSPVPVAPLITTFRSHPALIALPNRIAYAGQLVSGTPAQSRQILLTTMRFPAPNIPFMFVDVKGESAQAPSKSYYNESEAQSCQQLLEHLIRLGIPARYICVITFYREQYRQIKPTLDSLNVELTTVDSVQGREKEVVILLTTKTDFSPATAEFLNDYRRLNVAVSRCRHGQIVFGHAESLRKVPTWNTLLQWADSIGAVVPANDLPQYLQRPL
ncbi:hypothetical protein V3C99_003843 [Haemonchus contortus]